MNFAVAPHERMDDGLLTVSVFSRYSKLQLWWHFASIAFGRHEYRPKSIAFRVASLRLAGPSKLPVHLDGTPVEDLWPVDMECKRLFCVFSENPSSERFSEGFSLLQSAECHARGAIRRFVPIEIIPHRTHPLRRPGLATGFLV